MTELEEEGFPRPGADHSRGVHPDVITVFGHPDLLALLRPSSSRTRVPFETGFIAKPQFHLRIFDQRGQVLAEGLACLMILAVGPRPGNLQAELLLLEKPDDRGIADFDLEGVAQVAVEFHTRPVGHADLLRRPQNGVAVGRRRGVDLSGPSRVFLLDEAVDAPGIEASDPRLERRFLESIQAEDLLASKPQDQGIDSMEATAISLASETPDDSGQIVGRGVFGVGEEEFWCHGSNKTTALSSLKGKNTYVRKFQEML